MANKPRPQIIEVSDFRAYLLGRMYALGLNPAGLAEKLGISAAATYALLSGEESPSDKVIRKVGLRPCYVADQAEDEDVIPVPGTAKLPVGKSKK